MLDFLHRGHEVASDTRSEHRAEKMQFDPDIVSLKKIPGT